MIDPPSPCVRNCALDARNICLGCARTIDEIIEWGNATPARRQEILDLLPARMAERRR